MLETVNCRENAEMALLFIPILLIVISAPKPKYRNGQIFFQTQEKCFRSLFLDFLFQDDLLLLTFKIFLQFKHSLWSPDPISPQMFQCYQNCSLLNLPLQPVCSCSCTHAPHPFPTYGRYHCWINNISCRDFILRPLSG